MKHGKFDQFDAEVGVAWCAIYLESYGILLLFVVAR